MKRAVSISLVLVMILGLFTSCQKKTTVEKEPEKSTFVRSDKNDDFEFDVYEDYTVITQYIGEDFRVSIPNRLGGKAVKSIGEKAIGDSMLAVDIVDIPKNVTYIHPSAFYGCDSLTVFTVAGGNSVYKSEDGLIYSKDGKALLHYPVGRDKSEVTVNKGVEKIGAYAFGQSDKITKVSLPDSVKEIGAHAFDGCDKLISVNIPEGVKEIGEYCFYECSALPSIKLPSTLLKIGESAFNYCISISEIKVPDSVVEIADSAFYKCETLSKVTLSASLAKYGYKVFSGCKLLTEIGLSSDNKNFAAAEGMLYTADGKTLVDSAYGKYISSLKIKDGVTAIRAYCFYRDYQGQEQDNFDNIGAIDFNKVEKIGAYAFANRDGIHNVNLPSTLKEISSTTFYNCQKIEKYSVKDCAAYTAVDGVLYTKDKKTLVTYPSAREKSTYSVPEGTEHIGEYAFSNCYTLHELTVPESLVTVGDYAFYMTATIVGSIKFGKNLKSIGKYCFSHCAGLEEVTFEDNTITEIPKGAFEVFDGAYEFVIPDGVTKIGEDAFRETGYIVYIEIPSTVKEIEKRAFYDMDDLHDLTIPAGVEKFGDEIVNILDESDPDKVTLKVTEGSKAEKYAKDNNIPYKVAS